MTCRSLVLPCLVLFCLTLPLPAQEDGGNSATGGLLKRAGEMWKSSGADKVVEDAGELARQVGKEIEAKSIDELVDEYFLRPAKGVVDYYNGKPCERVINDLYGENEDETGKPETSSPTPQKETQGANDTPGPTVVPEEGADSRKGKEKKQTPQCYKAKNKEDAIAYVLRQSERCVSPISVTFRGMPRKFSRQLIKHVFAHGSATCASGWEEDDTATVRFDYTDDTRLKACHAGIISKDKLQPKERMAYEKALRIVKQVKEQHATDYERAVALHDYLVLHARYDRSQFRKLNGAATTLLMEGRGVCSAYMRSYSILLNIAGIENAYITGGNHGWNLVKLEGEWTHVDVTWDDPVPDKKGRVIHHWFGMTDGQIRKSHRWNRSLYPQRATCERLYYPKRP